MIMVAKMEEEVTAQTIATITMDAFVSCTSVIDESVMVSHTNTTII
jgi:hypothetical protein